MADPLRESIVRAIVHLNFNEPEQARDLLLVALAESSFTQSEKPAPNESAHVA